MKPLTTRKFGKSRFVNSGQLGLLNVARAQLGWTQADYDAAVKERFGVKSAKELTQAMFSELMKHLTACGFKYEPKVKRAPRIKRQRNDRQQYLEAIRTGLNALGKDWGYAEAIAVQMKFPAKLEWCEPWQLHKIQVALIYETRKQAGDPVQRKPETLAKRRGQGSGIRGQQREEAI